MGEIFFHRSSAVFRRRTSDLVHLTICFPRIRSSQRIIARVEWELAICRKNRNRTRTNISEISIQSAMEAVSCVADDRECCGKVVSSLIDDVAHVIFGVIAIILKTAPLGASGAMAYTI